MESKHLSCWEKNEGGLGKKLANPSDRKKITKNCHAAPGSETNCEIPFEMKTVRNLFPIWLAIAMLMPGVVKAQLIWTVVNGAAAITGFNGNPTILTIPSSTNVIRSPASKVRHFKTKSP
jgi:hypothetical protein